MPQRKLFRFLLFAVLGLIAGFLALAIAVPIEQQIPAALIALFSPGLKLAELVTPETGKSFAWSFGWFLRIAILANAAFYFAITDRQGAQLSQECPPPINNQSMGTNNRTAQSLCCGRWFRLG